MRHLVISFALLLLILLTSISVQAVNQKDLELQAVLSPSDVAPQAGPVAYHQNPADDMWDMIWFSDAGITCADNQLLGGEFAGGQYYITGGNNAVDPNKLYILDADGMLLNTVDQWSAAGWGWRDLAYDGMYLYGSDDGVVDAFDLDGNAVPEMNINTSISINRALAYDPVQDHFWSKSFGDPLYEFDRSGTVVWSGSPAVTACYGAAWDEGALDGPWLWLFDQTGSPQTTVFQFDPINYVLTGVSYTIPLVGASTAQLAGGLFFTDETTPGFWTMGGVTQGTPDDMIFLLEMYVAADPLAPAAPDNLTATPDPGGVLEVTLTWDLPTTTVNGQPISMYPITSVEIMRDDVALVSLPATAIDYIDAVPAVGEYTYAVYCVNSYGDGIQASASAWAGLDAPAMVENLVGAGVGTELSAELSWDNPTTGMHGGYFPAGSIDGYTINRYGPSEDTFDLPGLNTMFLDDTIPIQGWYHYGVMPYNSSGNGPETMTDEFYVGPPEYEEIPYDWVEINATRPDYDYMGTNTGITLDDQNVGPFDMGMNFLWYDGVYQSSIRVCSNGFATFTSTVTAYTNAGIPSTAEPNNLVAPYWDDMNPSSSYYGTVWYYADPGGEFFVVEWDSMNHYGSTIVDEYFTFESILYPDGTIDFMYRQIEEGNMTPFPSATVGIENADGTQGIQLTYNGSGPWEPDDEMGVRIYPVSTPSIPELEVTMVPVVYPIQIPASGGSFDFYAFITNNGATSAEFDAWVNLVDPLGITSDPLMGPVTISLSGGETRGWFRTQNIAGTAMAGVYQYVGNVGMYPDMVYDSDQFEFEKMTTGDGPWMDNWDNYGDPFGIEEIAASETVPIKYAIYDAYPNPFNPTTTIGFSLPEAGKVTLAVYDLQGRIVAKLVNGYRNAGVHQVTFDGTGLASGVYIYNLHAGDFSANGKMIMMK